MDLTLAELQEMASRQQQQIEAQQQMLATKVMSCFKSPSRPPLLVYAQSCLLSALIVKPLTSQVGADALSPEATCWGVFASLCYSIL